MAARVQAQNRGGSGDTYVGDPINFVTGNAYDSETDYTTVGSFPLALARYYNSQDKSGLHELGYNWRVAYSRSLFFDARTGNVTVTRDDGQELKFIWWYGVWIPPVYSNYRLSLSAGGFMLTTDQDETETYSITGKLLFYANRAGLTLTLGYDALSRLSTVTDAFGRRLAFSYNASSLISQAQAPDGGVYAYEYDSFHRLTSVRYPDGSRRGYLYQPPGILRGLMTGVIDENGSQYATFAYSARGRAISTQHAGGADLYTVNASLLGAGFVSVTGPLGGVNLYKVGSVNGLAKTFGTQRFCSDCPTGSSGWEGKAYDSRGNLTGYTDFNGNRAAFTYDLTRNVLTSQTLAAGTSVERTILMGWHPNFRLPTQIVDGARTFTFTYDAKGNLLTSTVASGSSTSTSAYTYNSAGQALTATDPLGRVTRYAYDARGNLTSVTNPLGQVASFTSYDANGRPLTIRDPNGVLTTLTYNFRGQIVSRVTLGQTTTYSYDKVGQLIRLQAPSGAALNFGYDAAHRLTSCESAWNKDPVFGVIGIQSGPRG